MATLVPLPAVDPAMVEALLDRSFGEDRKARTAYRIREGAPQLDALSFAALDEEEYLVGSIQAWPIALTDPQGRSSPLIMVGPVAVMPGRQGEGFGKGLMSALLGSLAQGGTPDLPQFLIGDAEYYGQWGFADTGTADWQCPGPVERHRLLVRCDNPAVLPRDGMLGPWLDGVAPARDGGNPNT